MISDDKEYISALVDSEELSLDELDTLVANKEHQETWHKYHVIQAVLKKDLRQGQALDISAAVMQQVKHEPHKAINPFLAAANSLWKPAAHIAIAASVALFTVTGVLYYQNTSGLDRAPSIDSQTPYQPNLKTVPMGVIGNPLSYSATYGEQEKSHGIGPMLEKKDGEPLEDYAPANTIEAMTDKEKAVIQQQLQIFLMDHQIQVQRSLESSSQVKKETKESSNN